MTEPLIWINGQILRKIDAVVAAQDHGLLIGDGVFDTLSVREGVLQFPDRHFRRLRHGIDRLGIEPTPTADTLRSAIDGLIETSGITRGRVRITVTPGVGGMGRSRGSAPTTIITIEPAAPVPVSVTLTRVDWIRNERSPLTGIKSTSWSENAQILRSVRSQGFDEAVLCDSTGLLSECCAANLFLVIGGEIITPSVRSGCLPGIIREVLLDSGLANERDLAPELLTVAEEIFISSSINEIVGVSGVDDRQLLVDGPATLRARAAVANAD
jgi:branched-chain amino acid aminotransferase